MDLLFDCPACSGPLVADESARFVLNHCAHCAAAVSVPHKARSARTISITQNPEPSPDGQPARVIRRVRPAPRQVTRSLIETSARITPIPEMLPNAWRAA